MTAKTKGAAISGLMGAGVYLAVEVLFRWSKLGHESWREMWENLGFMAFLAAVFVVTYRALARLTFRRYGYQANTSKSER
jgi:hypothetical protein